MHRQANPSGALTSPPRGMPSLARQDHCVQIIAAAIPLHPTASATTIAGMWRHDQGGGGQGTAMVRRLAAMLVDCVVAGARSNDVLKLLCGEQKPGLLANRVTDVMLRCAASQLGRLLHAFLAGD